MKGDSELGFLILVALTLPLIWGFVSNGGFIGFRSTNSTSTTTDSLTSSNCQSYIDQISSMQGQIDQLNRDASSARNQVDSSSSLYAMLGGFLIGAVVVTGYFLWHEQKEKRRKEFEEMYFKGRRKRV